MPITDNSLFGTEKDGKINQDYCIYCYNNGEFVHKVSLEEYIEMNVPYFEQAGLPTKEAMREYCQKVFPTLLRWKK